MFNLAIGILGVITGAFLTVLWNMIRDMRQQHEELRKDVNSNYVRRDDYRDDLKDLKEMLNMILVKLDKKADKS